MSAVLRVAKPREEVADGIGHGHGVRGLPGSFFNARNLAISGEFAEADTTDTEETHVAAFALAEFAAVVDARGELHFLSFRMRLRAFCVSFLPAEDESVASHEGGRDRRVGEYCGKMREEQSFRTFSVERGGTVHRWP